MPAKSIIDIEIDTTAFDKFKASYAAYEQSLGKTPEAWEKVTKEAGRTAEEFLALVTAATAGVALATELAEAEKATAKELDLQKHAVTGQAKSWHDMAKDSRSFATNIGAATISLLRWSTITGAISGIIGAGGLFGIEHLATSAAADRHLAGGTGTTIGERKAFETNFSPTLDNPSGFLTGVFESLTDPQKSPAFSALGLNYQAEQKKGTAAAAIDVMRAMKELADKTPEANLGTVFNSFGLGQFGGSIQDFQREKSRPRSEIEAEIRGYNRDQATLNITDKTAKNWEDLNVKLKRAGEQIEKILITDLGNLAGPIGHLSESVVKGIEAFMDSPKLAVFIDGVATSLDNFATKIGTPEFDKGITDIADGIGKFASSVRDDLPGITTVFNAIAALGHGLAAAYHFLDQNGLDMAPAMPGGDPGGAPSFQLPGSGKLPTTPPAFKFNPNKPTPDFMPFGGSDYNPVAYRQSAGGSPLKIGERVNEAHDFFRFAGWSEAQTAGLLANIGAESGFNPGARNASGHVGLAQWDRNRAAQFRARYGHDVTAGSFEEQLDFVQYELTHGEKAAGDKLRAIGRADAAAKSLNSNYERSGTAGNDRASAANSYQQSFRDRSVQVKIENNTGGSVHVAATQLVGT
jgi:hypothetical protein